MASQIFSLGSTEDPTTTTVMDVIVMAVPAMMTGRAVKANHGVMHLPLDLSEEIEIWTAEVCEFRTEDGMRRREDEMELVVAVEDGTRRLAGKAEVDHQKRCL